ncbi:MAG: sugar phosphate isomerase/epimerase family protein [Balneolaceae bacterium]
MELNRKEFLKSAGFSVAALSAFSVLPFGLSCSREEQKRTNQLYKISLAQWSLHKTYFGEETMQKGWEYFGQTLQSSPSDLLKGTEDPLYFAQQARRRYDIDAVEYVNTFYFDKAQNQDYLRDLKQVADDEGVNSLLIMCDAEGALGDPDSEARQEAVENHYKWVETAKFLGCHSIRVNAQSSGTYEEQMKLAADGLHSLAEFGGRHEINIIVENHGGLSSNADWLVGVIEMTDHARCGTLPDFGNFRISEDEVYDRYEGTEKLMPYAKGVSAKSHDFDSQGNETSTDFYKMMQIVINAGYSGYVGIEYEGSRLSEDEGIRATKKLLETVRAELTEA